MIRAATPDPLADEAREGVIGSMSSRGRHKILCIVHFSRSLKIFQSVLHPDQYEVLSVVTADHAVAFFINNVVAAVVLDSEFLTEQGWSVAQTLKGLRPTLPVLLFAEGHCEVKIPQAVDAIARTPATMLRELQRLLDKTPRPVL